MVSTIGNYGGRGYNSGRSIGNYGGRGYSNAPSTTNTRSRPISQLASLNSSQRRITPTTSYFPGKQNTGASTAASLTPNLGSMGGFGVSYGNTREAKMGAPPSASSFVQGDGQVYGAQSATPLDLRVSPNYTLQDAYRDVVSGIGSFTEASRRAATGHEQQNEIANLKRRAEESGRTPNINAVTPQAQFTPTSFFSSQTYTPTFNENYTNLINNLVQQHVAGSQ